jgi:hypothetical protein
MKALCIGAIIPYNKGRSLLTIHFDTTLYTTLQSNIGQKSFNISGSSFFGIRTTVVSFTPTGITHVAGPRATTAFIGAGYDR